MPIEVEQKFRVTDTATIELHVAKLGGSFAPAIEQVDQYFAHPQRDFAHTDEALRIRSVCEKNFVTYKGPKLDQTTKTRHEIELPLEPGVAGARRFAELLAALGFSPVREVRKHRRKATVDWAEYEIEILLDEVAGVGSFAEIEIVVEPDQMDPAKQAIASLAERLELRDGERRSYLELLIEREGKEAS